MSKSCSKCGKLLLPGDTAYQVAFGHVKDDIISPSLKSKESILLEYCDNHVPVPVDTDPQPPPYHCFVCEEEILNLAPVIFATHGTIPREPYRWLEGRGYGMRYIAHYACWAKLSSPPDGSAE